MQWILKDNAQPYSHIDKHTSKPIKSMLPVVSELRINYISVLWALHNNGVHSFCLLFVSPLNIFWNAVTSFLLCVCCMSKAERTLVHNVYRICRKENHVCIVWNGLHRMWMPSERNNREMCAMCVHTAFSTWSTDNKRWRQCTSTSNTMRMKSK